jgi:hypothetical protein
MKFIEEIPANIWAKEGMSVADLTEKLQQYDDHTLEVRISLDEVNHRPISLLGRGHITQKGNFEAETDDETEDMIYFSELSNRELGNNEPEWVTRGKSIAQLIKELNTFSDPMIKVKIYFEAANEYRTVRRIKNLSDIHGCTQFLMLC